jgi:transcriptional regulator with XRE-family HTH domain
MQPTEEQLSALGNYRDIIDQHLPEIAEGIGVPPQTLKGWMEGKGEPTIEQAQKILDFLRNKVGQGPEV